MELQPFLNSLPAFIAFSLKLFFFFYAYNSPIQNRQSRLFLVLLFALSIQNIAEIFSFFHGNRLPLLEGYTYFAASIVVLPLVVHLAAALATAANRPRPAVFFIWALYAYAALLEALLLFTPYLVAGFSPLGVSYFRIPGPLYPMFEYFAVACFVCVVALLAYGAVRQSTHSQRIKCQLMLIGMFPMALLVVANVTLMHFGINWINTPINFPITVTFFLLVTTYAVHQHRLFDIQFYIPWSRVRKRKTAFYDRIRALISEIADLVSVREVIVRLSDTLRCPVALVGGPTPVACSSANKIIDFPASQLRKIEHIVVANEIEDALPETYALMKKHGVAAIVPFYPHSENGASWLLLGDSFSEQVYTRLDFRVVEELFDKMAELFLDKVLAIRTQLADAHLRVQTLEYRIQTLEAALASMHERVEALSQENARLLREQPADSLVDAAPSQTMAAITLLGRDKEMLKRLRALFPQVEHFSGPESVSFRRQPAADLLICGLDSESPIAERRLLAVLEGEQRPRALLFYGSRARGFAYENRRLLRGRVAEVLPEQATPEALARRARALVELGRSLRSCADPDYPLIGRSPAFERVLNETRRIAGLSDPVLIRSTDACEALALAAYLHQQGSAERRLVTARVATFIEEQETATSRLRELLAQAKGGTLVLDNLCTMPNGLWDEMMTWADELTDVRLIAICPQESAVDANELMHPLRPLLLAIPPLRDRGADMALLVHYYTLQFNLQSGTGCYLTRSETDELLAADKALGLAAIKSTVYGRLASRDVTQVSAPDMELIHKDRTLAENVAEFESRLIEQTLRRCAGNKSKAARLLGLRPNTLHYKLEKYGLLDKKG